jgi:hypothetical protein
MNFVGSDMWQWIATELFLDGFEIMPIKKA